MRVCSRCVMDSSDSKIQFDDLGYCDHCNGFLADVAPYWDNSNDHKRLMSIADRIKRKSTGEYDCILGLSGGLDSSLLLHVAVKMMKLKPLVFHVDGGWNTDIAVSNIKNLVSQLGLDLFTEVIDWQDMKDFQLALFKSGTPHLDLAQDHAFFATMLKFANKYDIKFILNGGNFATECIRNPLEWIYYGTDMTFIKDVLKKHCQSNLRNYPWSSIYYGKIYLKYFKGISVVRPLNHIKYIKNDAEKMLATNYGWRGYGQKHFESRFTKFYEGYWMPERFGFDTRKVQYSSLIMTGQMSRDEALRQLQLPPYPASESATDFQFVADKLGISVDELSELMRLPLKNFRDFKNEEWVFRLGALALKLLGHERAIKR